VFQLPIAQFPELSMSGVIEPGAKAAVAAAGAKECPLIAVIATEATIRSKAYERAIHRRRHYARLLLRPAPLLVPIIEEGRTAQDPLVQLALKQYIVPLLERDIDVLVLGCTHYPILKNAIQALVGLDIRVIDSAERCAEDVARRLTSAGLLRGGALDPAEAALKCFVTDGSPRFAALAKWFMGIEVAPPSLVSLDELHRCGAQLELRQAG
jgi:glutamate racemase